MDNKALYKRSLQKILESSEFKDSPTYTNLLSYLFEFFLKEETPKEATIAMEFLNRDSSFNPSEDPIVRVYIHEIRKRLKTYYQTEGKKEKIRLEIPKGGYGLKFINITKRNSRARLYLNYVLSILLFFSIIILVILFKDKTSHKKSDLYKICASNIWSDILNNEKPILIVFGDVFFFREEKGEKKGRSVRDEDINSIEELELYKTTINDPSLEISPLKQHTYLIEYCPYSLLYLLPILNTSDKPISIRLCSELTVDELKTHNIIYVGFTKCLGAFKFYFQKSRFNLRSRYSLSYFDKMKDSLFVYSTEKVNVTNYHMDYGFVIKFLGPNNNNILLLTGTRLTGTLGAVDKVANRKSIEEIETVFKNKYNALPDNFEMLYEVFGLNRQFIQSDILYFENMDTKIQGLWTQRPE